MGSKYSTFLPSLDFQADPSTKTAALVSGCKHFRFLHCNRWTDYGETWWEESTRCPPPSLFFCGPIGKRRWPPWTLIVWYIFDFSANADWDLSWVGFILRIYVAFKNLSVISRLGSRRYPICEIQDRDRKSNPGPLFPLAKSLHTRSRFGFVETWWEAGTYCPLPSPCCRYSNKGVQWYSRARNKALLGHFFWTICQQRWLHLPFIGWYTSPMQLLNSEWRNLTEKRYPTSFNMFSSDRSAGNGGHPVLWLV